MNIVDRLSNSNKIEVTTNDKALKVIFIAGNETFTQGQVDYVTAINEAVKKDIIVNTIFCGNYYEGINTFWKDGADRGNGKYMSIDQNRKVIDIRAPQDDRIIELGIALNDTYIVYGEQGAENKELQTSQDSNAQQMSNDSYVQRQVAKSSSFYSNASWDLVDAVRLGVVKIEEVDNELLPENMKSMDIEEKEAYIQEMQEMRDSIQAEINQLNIERNEYIENELKNQSGEDSLDTAKLILSENKQKKQKILP